MTRVLDRVRRILLTGSAFVVFFMGGALLSYVLLPIAWRWSGGGKAEAARRCRALLGSSWVYFHWYMRVCGLLRYDPRATRLALPQGPFVLVANHPTLVDVTALLSAHPEVVSVAKSVMFRSPLVGRLLRYCDHVDAGDGSAFSGVAVASEAVERLRAGTPVLIFPEGTRSPEQGLGQFRHGAFDIAARAGVPIIPVCIRCEPPTLMRGQRWYEIPERPPELTVSQLPTLWPPHGPPRDTARALRSAYLERIGAPSRDCADAEVPAHAGSDSISP
jgi:1-acyl-sn-glycerol-3-phosphate acyltransferase